MCQALNTLPRVGGLLDQDARLMYLFNVVYAAQKEREALDNDRRRQQQEDANAKARMRR